MNKEESSKKVFRRLQAEFIVVWLLVIGLFGLYETGILEEGILAHDGRVCYILQTASILLTLCLIPASLKMFGQAMGKSIENEQTDMFLKRYQRWSEIRLALLAIVILIDLSVYYTTLSSIGGLCAVVGLTATLFCWPENIKSMD